MEFPSPGLMAVHVPIMVAEVLALIVAAWLIKPAIGGFSQ